MSGRISSVRRMAVLSAGVALAACAFPPLNYETPDGSTGEMPGVGSPPTHPPDASGGGHAPDAAPREVAD
ncbi:MAG: hypothetical protein FWD17_18420, partial [Polyangiaceae bacterium]|nr:hypothetical protein [Polyangiaceae bacterium]